MPIIKDDRNITPAPFPPHGSNELGAKDSFHERTYYKEWVYPSTGPVPMDFWYKDPLYGRVNQNKSAVYLGGLTNMKLLDANDASDPMKAMMVLDFVSDAYKEFRQKYAITCATTSAFAAAEEDDALKVMTVEKAAVDANALYHSYMQSYLDGFSTEYLVTEDRMSQIVKFEDFAKLFMGYIEAMAPLYPFTKSSWLLSKYCPCNISGLVIELSNKKLSDDFDKYKWISDPKFETYRYQALQHGFLVDKNAPWRLIADITSPKMAKYMDYYGLNLDNLFDVYYHKAHHLDMDVIKKYFFEYYNDFVKAYPYAKKTVLTRTSTKICSVKRKLMDIDEFDEKYNDFYWMRAYTYIKAREKGLNFGQAQFDKKVQTAHQYYWKYDVETALDYIDFEMRKFAINHLLGSGGKAIRGQYKFYI